MTPHAAALPSRASAASAKAVQRPRKSLFNSLDADRDDPVANDDESVAPDRTAMGRDSDFHGDAAISASTTDAISHDVAPFLSKHIPKQYAPQGHPDLRHKHEQVPSEQGNTRYCYRHRPDRKCRRPADEPTMEELQSSMDKLPEADQKAVTHVWSVFSAAPASMRKMILQGIMQQCCFPQLSFIAAQVRDLIRIDFLDTLPPEISFKILSYLDSVSLCKAAQVSQRWRMLADDDVVWHKMCEQHIDKKCEKCGWGLPLLEAKRLRQSKRAVQLREKNPELFKEITASTTRLNIHGKRPTEAADNNTGVDPGSPSKRPCMITRASDLSQRTIPWKAVYKERFKVESNWRLGRCNTKVFRGHADGIMCLQSDDRILATGSYDCTIKIWDIETGAEIRTLTGHASGVRALQFDDGKLISGSMDHTVRVWDYHHGKCVSTLAGHSDGVLCVNFDQTTVVSGSVDKTVRIWDFAGKAAYSLQGHTDWVNSVRLDTDSRTIFSASDDHSVRMWDLDSRSCIKIFDGHIGPVQQVVPLSLGFPDTFKLPPGSKKLPPASFATASLDSTVKIWDTATGKCTKTLFGHVEGVWALAADSLRIISGAQDASLKVWDVESGRCQRTITGHQGPVTCVHLGDSRMVTGGEDGQARMYCFKDCEKDADGARVVGSCGENIS